MAGGGEGVQGTGGRGTGAEEGRRDGSGRAKGDHCKRCVNLNPPLVTTKMTSRTTTHTPSQNGRLTAASGRWWEPEEEKGKREKEEQRNRREVSKKIRCN